VLNSYGQFAIPAVTPVILNLCLIASAFIDAGSVRVLAYAVFVAGILQFMFQWPALIKLRLLPRPRWGWKDLGWRPLIPRIIGLALAMSAISSSRLRSRSPRCPSMPPQETRRMARALSALAAWKAESHWSSAPSFAMMASSSSSVRVSLARSLTSPVRCRTQLRVDEAGLPE